MNKLLYFFTFLLLHQSTFLSANIIEQTCYRSAKTDPNLNYNYCVKLLYSDPNSPNADLSGLGVISVKIAEKKAVFVQSFAQKLLNSISSDKKYEKQCLENCVEIYSDAVSGLRDSADAIKFGRINDARTWLSAAYDAGGNCEDGFNERGLSSPVRNQDQDYVNTVVVPLAIAALLDSN